MDEIFFLFRHLNELPLYAAHLCQNEREKNKMKMVRRENKMKEKKTKRMKEKEPRWKYAAEKRKGMKSIKRRSRTVFFLCVT